MLNDWILIRDLKLFAVIGTRPEERRAPQELLLNLELETDLSAAGRSDALEDALDYSQVETRVAELVEHSHFLLLEKLAAEVADAVLAFPPVRRVAVTIDKPGAPRLARSIAVRIVRSKPSPEEVEEAKR